MTWIVLGAIVVVGIALATRARRAVKRANTTTNLPKTRIDPFTIDDPWRRFVTSSQSATKRFRRQVEATPPGPLRDRLLDIANEVDRVAQECWETANRGHRLSGAIKALRGHDLAADITRVRIERETVDDPARQATLDETASSLENRQGVRERLRALETSTIDRLRQLDAVMQEHVARAAELSVTGSEPSLDSFEADVTAVATELEALRLAIEETTKVQRQTGLG